ncbi:MAG: DUF2207 domain-containing protein [Acidobacteriota bacterium]|nr:MAG: DUF2207 domain-containing protein [Acidobacteriota bacterium]
MIRRIFSVHGKKLPTSLFLLGLFLVPALARSLEISHFQAEIWVENQGQILITETIEADFKGSWNGLYRLIPVVYQTPRDPNFHLDLDILSVTDESGRKLEWQDSREGRFRKVKIWVPGAQDQKRTIVLRYSVGNAIQFFDEHDELYWNATGDEWEIPIKSSRAVVHLPKKATGIRSAGYTGPYASREQAVSISVLGPDITFSTQRELGLFEGLTIAVAWDPGAVERPSLSVRMTRYLLRNWLLIVPLLVFIGMYLVWSSWGRDPAKGPLVPSYQPPADLSPAAVGTLADNTPDLRDVTATIVDLAIRGLLKIEESRQEKFLGLYSSNFYTFHQTETTSSTDQLRPYEKRILDALFDDGLRASVSLKDLENSFYKELKEINNQIFAELLVRKYYRRRPDKLRQPALMTAIGIGILTTAGMGPFADLLGFGVLQFALAGYSSALIIGIFAFLLPARTRLGAKVFDQIRGFEEFLTRVESDRYKKMITGPEMFEAYLPFAMALGVEERWARAFDGIYSEPPHWYSGSHAGVFRPSQFAGALNQMSLATGTALSSSPRSSGGSSFSGGGGSSGGGFGGGGGGGF